MLIYCTNYAKYKNVNYNKSIVLKLNYFLVNIFTYNKHLDFFIFIHIRCLAPYKIKSI